MVEDDVLEIGGEVDLGGLDAGKVAEGAGRERARAVLHRAGEPVGLSRGLRQRRQRLEVELDVGDRAVGQHDAAMRGARLHRDLADALVRAQSGEHAVVAQHEGVQLLHGAVLHPHFADLGPDRDDHTLGLEPADEGGDFGGTLEVEALLRVERRLVEIHQRGGVNVDVVEAGAHLLGDQLLHLADLALGVGGVLLLIDLAMIALDEERQHVSLAQRGTDQHRHVLRGPLVGVGDLRARDLENDGSRPARAGGAEDRAGGVVGHHPHVDGRDGKAAARRPGRAPRRGR